MNWNPIVPGLHWSADVPGAKLTVERNARDRFTYGVNGKRHGSAETREAAQLAAIADGRAALYEGLEKLDALEFLTKRKAGA